MNRHFSSWLFRFLPLSAHPVLRNLAYTAGLAVLPFVAAFGQVIYVDANAGGANNGSSWANAYTALQDAIDAAAPGGQIWAAAATYLPTKDLSGNPSPGDPLTRAFYINKDVLLYGGFAGGETSLAQRNVAANPTILSGDLDGDDAANPATDFSQINGSNAYHVVHLQQVTTACRLDGLTLTAGFNFGTGGGIFCDGQGAGQFSSPTIHDCTVSGNYSDSGGGIFCDGTFGGISSPVLSNCRLTGNRGEANGGGFLANGRFGGNSHPVVSNCLFSNNSSRTGGGLIMTGYLGSGTISVVNCVFQNNYTTAYQGGAMYLNFSDHTLKNCTFYGNHAVLEAGAVYSENGPTSIENCIFWNNTSSTSPFLSVYDFVSFPPTTIVTYSMIEEAACSLGPSTSCGAGVIFATDPLFVDAPAGNFKLLCNSPAVDAGTSMGAPSDDFAGNARPIGAGVDMGAFEYGFSASLPSCKTVYKGYAPMACATLAAAVSGGSPPYSYAWSHGAATASVSVCPTSTTTYQVTVTDAGGCTATDATSVEVEDVRCGNNNNPKVVICHIPPGNPGNKKTHCIASSAVASHLAHGDHLGSCGFVPCAGGGLAVGPGDGSLVLEAQPGLREVELSWVTNLDDRTGKYEVEKSTDGVHFEPLTAHPAKGDDASWQFYHDIDRQPVEGFNFYRIRIEKQDGSEELSAVKSVFFEPLDAFTLSPNPAGKETWLFLPEITKDRPCQIWICNQLGNRMKEESLQALPDALHRLSLDGLPEGVYFVFIQPEGRRAVARILVVGHE